MPAKYHIKACLLLALILNLTVLLTQKSSSHLPNLGQGIVLVFNSTFSLLVCWLAQARLKLYPPKAIPSPFMFWISVTIGTVLLLSIDLLMEVIIPKHLSINDPSVSTSFPARLLACLFVSLVCYIVFNSLFTRDMLLQARLEVERLKQAGLRTQVMGLQQQLSPHFLFNSLSTLKGLATESTTKEFIMQLSLIYRYLLDSTEHAIVTLADELEFTKAYLYVQQKRFGAALKVDIDVPAHCLPMVLPPLSLQLLIENAIKHNSFSQQKPLTIAIYFNGNDKLVVQNNYSPTPIPTEGKGVGLQNICDRFSLLFKKDITINALPDTFTVHLPLTADENTDH